MVRTCTLGSDGLLRTCSITSAESEFLSWEKMIRCRVRLRRLPIHDFTGSTALVKD
jgi:hypothetical protein